MDEHKTDRVLILQHAPLMTAADLEKMHDNIMEQVKSGVVVLPPWLHFVACTEDMITDVKILEA